MRTADHFYQHNGVYVPSVTKVLDIIAKGEYFNAWLKKQGDKADGLVRDAGDFGTNMHDLFESVGKGAKINLEALKPKQRFLIEGFLEWNDKNVKRFISTEHEIITDLFGGTLDAEVELKTGEIARLDYKTGFVSEVSDIQISTYDKGEELNGNGKADKLFILSFDKRDGAKVPLTVKEVKNRDENYELFLCARRLWIWKFQDKLDKVNKDNK